MIHNYPRSKTDTSAIDAFNQLSRAASLVTARVQKALPANITFSQFAVLEALHHTGDLCPGELAGKLGKSAGNLTLVIDNLEKGGFVARERTHDDRRYVSVRLTDRGRTFAEEAFPAMATAVINELSALSPAEQFTLGWLCQKLKVERLGELGIQKK